MISSIVIARLVDKTEYAYLSYVDNLYSYLTLFSGLGLASALLVFCIDGISKGKHKSYVKNALIIGSLFEGLASIILCIAVQFTNIPYEEARKYMWLLVLYPVITYIFTCLQSYIRVLKDNKLYAKLGAAQTIIVCILSVATAIILGVYGVVLSRYIAIFIVLLMAIIFVNGKLKPIEQEYLSKAEMKAFISTAVALMVANVFSGMMPINESFLVNHLIREESVTASFKVAGIIPSLLPIVTSSIMVYYFPIIASIKNDYKVVKKKVHKIALINAAIIICITAIGMIFTPFTIKLIYGTKYMDAIPLSYPLWIMRALNTGIRMVPLNVLAAIGKSKFNAVISAITCIIHAILDYFFISFWNIQGIAYAAMIVYVLSAIILWWYFNRSCDKMSKQQIS